MRALLAVFVLSAALCAQEGIPAGTVLPVRLTSALDSRRSAPGKLVTARLAQDVPLPDGSRIPARSRVTGHVLEVTSLPSGARLVLQFNTVKFRKQDITLITDLRAMASMMEVAAAQIPTTGMGIGDVWAWMDTNQVGGDAVYGEGGPVMHGSEMVGNATTDRGVLVRLLPNRDAGCRGTAEPNDRPQALWVFSSDACGLYGFPGLKVAHAGRTAPRGQIVLESTDGPLRVSAGSGLLLRVLPSR